MIGGGGKIGGPPAGLPRVDVPTGAPAAKSEAPATTAGAPNPARSDGFEKAQPRAGGTAGRPPLSGDQHGVNLHQLARENPAAAKQLVASMAAQADKTLSSVMQELAGARAALAQLGAQKFSKKAVAEKSAELRRRRDKLASLKLRARMGARKMSFLQQVAGQLEDSDLEEELEHELNHHQKLQTDWGRAHHLLDMADLVFSGDEDTPEHLREVVKAEVRAGHNPTAVSEAMESISPRRVIAELIARTLDGTTLEPEDDDHGWPEVPNVGRRGEHGTALQTWATLGDVMIEALGKDPLAKKKSPDGR